MVIVVIISIILAALRLSGQTGVAYQALAHCFVGFLFGYWLASHVWMYMFFFVSLCVVDVYAVAVKYFPTISISNLINIIAKKGA